MIIEHLREKSILISIVNKVIMLIKLISLKSVNYPN